MVTGSEIFDGRFKQTKYSDIEEAGLLVQSVAVSLYTNYSPFHFLIIPRRMGRQR
jgi:hypothetical protein